MGSAFSAIWVKKVDGIDHRVSFLEADDKEFTALKENVRMLRGKVWLLEGHVRTQTDLINELSGGGKTSQSIIEKPSARIPKETATDSMKASEREHRESWF